MAEMGQAFLTELRLMSVEVRGILLEPERHLPLTASTGERQHEWDVPEPSVGASLRRAPTDALVTVVVFTAAPRFLDTPPSER